MRSPITWYGGKGKMTAKLLPFLQTHHTYVEPFGGGASLLFAKEPSKVEVYNDLDSSLVNFFRVLRDPDKFAAFHRLAALTPYSREEYYHCRETWAAEPDDVQRAWKFFVVARMSFGGLRSGGWRYEIIESRGNMTKTVFRWLAAIKGLSEVHDRLMRVQIDQRGFREIIEVYDRAETFFYCDPPYILSTRCCEGYIHEMSDDDHAALVELLLALKGNALVSGYSHPIYDRLDAAGWQRYEFTGGYHDAGRTNQPRTEVAWLKKSAQSKFNFDGGTL